MPAAKGRRGVQLLAALAVLAAVALPAGASIPRPGQLLGPNPEALLAVAREAPAQQAPPTSRAAGFQLFAGSTYARFHMDLHAAAEAPAEARFHLLTPRETRVRGFRLPEPLVIGVDLPPTRTAFRLYGDVPYGFASGGLYVTTDPLGYVDGPNLYQYGLNNPVNFADPMGDRIRFRRVDNEDQIGALSAEERSLIEAELGAFIGADFSIDPETGELFLETVRPDASEFGVELLSYLAADLTRDFEVFVYDHGFVDIAGSVSGVQREPAPVFLDLGDITGAEHQVVPLSMSERLGGILGKTEEGLEDFTTGGVGAFLVHELVHSDTGLDDPERERMGQVTGPVVDLVNIIREERGFLLRGPGYYERREGQSLNRIVMSFTNAEDKVRARVIFKSFILARDGARHKGWCEKENKRAAKEGRRSRCIGSRVFNQ